MITYKSLLIIILIFFSYKLFAQPKEYRYRVYINQETRINQDVSLAGFDTIRLHKNDLLESTRKYTVGGVEYTMTRKDTLKKDSVIYAVKKTTTPRNLSGKANISVDKTDPSRININYWLGSAYDRSGKYWIKLQNRESYKFRFKTLEAGILSIPFRVRPGIRENGKSIVAQASSDLTIGSYIGGAIGKIRYWYREGYDMDVTKQQIGAGVFFGLAKVTLDEKSTKLSGEILDESRDIVTANFGFGVTSSIYDFRIGVFAGQDFAFGTTSKMWNYHGKWWYGFGVGYNLGFLRKPN